MTLSSIALANKGFSVAFSNVTTLSFGVAETSVPSYLDLSL